MRKIYQILFRILPTMYYSYCSGIRFNPTHQIVGKIRIIKKGFLFCMMRHEKNGKIVIGNNFKCNNKVTSNFVGLIQPCVFNISATNSRIIIGSNVGISGSTINATTSITIGDNVMIGSGCLITDTDSHPLHWKDRLDNRNDLTAKAPIVISDNVFIGARSIILKGVTIGEGAVVGAGSVVSKDVPPYTVVCGNPAKIVKSLK